VRVAVKASVLVSVLLIVFSRGLAVAQRMPCDDYFGEESILRSRANNVVKITVPRAGYGLVIGHDNEGFWVAAPAHVVFGDTWRESGASNRPVQIRAQLASGAELLHTCETSDKPRPILDAVDLTFFCLAEPASTVSLPAYDAIAHTSPSIGEKIRLLAAPDVIGPTQAVAILRSIDNNGILSYDQFLGVQGQSGAGATTPRGIIGIFLAHGGARDEAGNILSIAEIERRAHIAEVPYQLSKTTTPDCKVTRTVCPRFDRATPSSVKWIGAQFPQGVLAEGCIKLTGGTWQVLSGDIEYACKTRQINVPTSSLDTLHPLITCTPDLTGIWATNGYSYVTCNSFGDVDNFECVPLTLPGGNARLRLTLQQDRFSVTGELVSPDGSHRGLTGALRFEKGRLAGAVAIQNGGEISLVMSR
jgi:hypothetical protein